MHLTADIYTRTGARKFFFGMGLCSSTPGDGKRKEGKARDGTGLACVFALCLILYLDWEHVFGGMTAAADKHSLYLVLYKSMYKMRVNPLG